MTTAAIYARYSTDRQNERSIEDQFTLCRSFAEREGLEVVSVYEDRARSGGSLFGRDGIATLMRHAGERRFAVVIVEALDRLSRDMEDLAGIHKRLQFAEIQIRAVYEGEVDDMLIGLRGLFGQYFRRDLKNKIRRGMAGRALDGLSGGGLAYGYAAVPGQPGARAILESEAAIVRRIFEEYVAGHTPRSIARRLNSEGVPAPQGGTWNSSTLNGNSKRGVGMLRNELYAGRLIWGRTRKIVSPTTGRELIRPTADAAVAAEVPQLAIVARALFDAAAARKTAMAKVHPGQQRKRTHLLSGLLRCGACGAGLYVHGTNKHGQRRLACSRERESGDCPDPHTYMLPTVERAVLSGLQAELRQPIALAEFARSFEEESRRLVANSGAKRRELEREIAQAEARLKRVIDCIADGHGDPAVLGPQSTTMHQRLETLRAELATVDGPVEILRLHPAAIERYHHHVEHLSEMLCAADGLTQGNAADAVRSLIETVTIWRGDAYGRVRALIRGRLATLFTAMEERMENQMWGTAERVMGIEPTS